MKITEIIESKQWRNKVTGETASIYGSLPYFMDAEKDNWEIETVGYTWKLDNGTIGIGRKPAKTYKEALEVMNKLNRLTEGR